MKIACVLAYGEPDPGFFPDTLAGLLCAVARKDGHDAELVRVYYHGRDIREDARIAERFTEWLEAHAIDVVVLERLFDPEPVRAHVRAAPHRRAVMICRGDSFDPVEGVDLAIGAVPGATRSGHGSRTPTIPDLVAGFRAFLEALSRGENLAAVPGVVVFHDGATESASPLPRSGAPLAFDPVLEGDVISPGVPPSITRRTLFGNVGCPYAADATETPLLRGVKLPTVHDVAQLGCSFCPMGGDYEKRADTEVVRELIDQARVLVGGTPALREFVLADQHALRYLAALMVAAREAGLPPLRWLFPARTDSFVRERARVEAAIVEAERGGHTLEVHLSGFEAFSDDELARYNKGVTAEEQIAAVEAMRAMARAHPTGFAYGQARAHSLILWNPWTTPEVLDVSVQAVRAHGMAELFHEMARNRLRLYQDLPILYAAERDGALTETWEDAVGGAGRRKGHSVERPWRFLDVRTRVAWELSNVLRDRLGHETEVAQLAAVTAFTRSLDDPDGAVVRVRDGLEALIDALEVLQRPRTPDGAPRGASVRAAPVAFAGACNNHCAACSHGDVWLDDELPALLERVDAARASGPGMIALVGREPTVHARFGAIVKHAHGREGCGVGVVTNGRRFAYEAFARACLGAGVRAVSVKLFAPDEVTSDAITETRGAHAQATAGVANLVNARAAVEIRVDLHARNLGSLEGYVQLAKTLGVRQLRVEAAVDAVGLFALAEAASGVQRLASACAVEGLALEASTLRAGTRAFTLLPV